MGKSMGASVSQGVEGEGSSVRLPSPSMHWCVADYSEFKQLRSFLYSARLQNNFVLYLTFFDTVLYLTLTVVTMSDLMFVFYHSLRRHCLNQRWTYISLQRPLIDRLFWFSAIVKITFLPVLLFNVLILFICYNNLVNYL